MSPVIDGLAFVGPSLFGGGQEEGIVLERMRRTGLDVTVVVPARPPDYQLAPANERVAHAQSESDGALIALARADPNQADAANEVIHALDVLGLSGLFLQPAEEHFRIADRRVWPLLEVCAERGKPVVIAAGYPLVSEALQIADLAGRFPTVAVVMTNGGQFNISGLGQLDAELALASCPNLSIQTTAVYRQDFIERVIDKFGAHRVMFAGGSPTFDPAYEILRARRAQVSESDKAMVLSGTAMRIFGLQGAL